MGTCSVGGQAVGTAVSLMKKYNLLPSELTPYIKELQQLILKDDGFIPGVKNEDKKDLARSAKVSASSFEDGYSPENVINGVSRPTETGENAWHSDGIRKGGEWLEFDLGQKKQISKVQLTFDSGFSYPIRMTMSDNRRKQQRTGVPPELVKDFTVELISGGKSVMSKSVKDNIRRMQRIDFPEVECDTVKICFNKTNGCEKIRVFEVRLY
jgi:hypothetical protein